MSLACTRKADTDSHNVIYKVPESFLLSTVITSRSLEVTTCGVEELVTVAPLTLKKNSNKKVSCRQVKFCLANAYIMANISSQSINAFHKEKKKKIDKGTHTRSIGTFGNVRTHESYFLLAILRVNKTFKGIKQQP